MPSITMLPYIQNACRYHPRSDMARTRSCMIETAMHYDHRALWSMRCDHRALWEPCNMIQRAFVHAWSKQMRILCAHIGMHDDHRAMEAMHYDHRATQHDSTSLSSKKAYIMMQKTLYAMRSLRLVSSLKSYVSFAEYCHFYRALL